MILLPPKVVNIHVGSGISDWVIGAISAAVAGALIVVAVLLIVPCVSLYKIKR